MVHIGKNIASVKLVTHQVSWTESLLPHRRAASSPITQISIKPPEAKLENPRCQIVEISHIHIFIQFYFVIVLTNKIGTVNGNTFNPIFLNPTPGGGLT